MHSSPQSYRCHHESALRAKVSLAANVYQQDELRGVKEVIRSFRALTKADEGSTVFASLLQTLNDASTAIAKAHLGIGLPRV